MKDIFENDSTVKRTVNPYTIEQKSEFFNRVITGEEILTRVMGYLTSKSMKEKIEQGIYNKSTLGNTQFWFNNTKDKYGNTLKSELAFNNVIEDWDFEQILINIEEAERNMMIADGIAIQ